MDSNDVSVSGRRNLAGTDQAPQTPGAGPSIADPLANALPQWDLVPATQFLRRR